MTALSRSRFHRSDEALLEERAIVFAAQRGDPGAWDVLYDRFCMHLFRFMARLTDGYDPEDLCQEVWMRVYNALPRFYYPAPHASFWQWIATIARREYLVYSQRIINRTQVVFLEEYHDVDGDFEDTTIRNVFARQLIKKITNPDHATVVYLRFWKQMNWEEIAAECERDVRRIRNEYELGLQELQSYLSVIATPPPPPKRAPMSESLQREIARRNVEGSESVNSLAALYDIPVYTVRRYARLYYPDKPMYVGEVHDKAKLNETLVREIRARYDAHEYYKDIAAAYNIAESTVYAIGLRRTWKHVE